MKPWGLWARLTVLLASMALAAAGITGFYIHHSSQALLVDLAQDSLLTSTQVLARRLLTTEREASRNLALLSEHPASLAVLQRPDARAREQVGLLFGLLMTHNPTYLQVRLIRAADPGMEVVRIDRHGNGLLQIQGDRLQQKGQDPYVSRALGQTTRTAFLSRLLINHEHGIPAALQRPTLQLAMPVMNAQGAAIGVVVISLDLEAAFQSLAEDLPAGVHLYLADDEGDILIHPDGSKAFGFDKGRRWRLQDEFKVLQDWMAASSRRAVFECVDQALAEGPQACAFMKVPMRIEGEDSHLVLGLGLSREQVLVNAKRLREDIARIMLMMAMASIVLATLLARTMTRPIQSLIEATRHFAHNLGTTHLPTRRQDEIGELARSIDAMQTQIRQQVETMRQNQEQLQFLADHDVLTGLPNRRLFQDRLASALARARRERYPVALLFIDLDQFKRINDQHGHDGGDAVLVETGKRLRSVLRESDTVARLGGDEFIVLLEKPGTREDIDRIVRKITLALDADFVWERATLHIGASVGVSVYPQQGQSPEELMGSADQAMYQAKLKRHALARDSQVA